MFIKIIMAGVLTTGVIGTTTVSGAAPTGIEFAAGPMRVEIGNGKAFAHMADHAPMALTIKLRGGGQLHIKL